MAKKFENNSKLYLTYFWPNLANLRVTIWWVLAVPVFWVILDYFCGLKQALIDPKLGPNYIRVIFKFLSHLDHCAVVQWLFHTVCYWALFTLGTTTISLLYCVIYGRKAMIGACHLTKSYGKTNCDNNGQVSHHLWFCMSELLTKFRKKVELRKIFWIGIINFWQSKICPTKNIFHAHASPKTFLFFYCPKSV